MPCTFYVVLLRDITSPCFAASLEPPILHIHRLIEAQHPITSQKSVYTVWRPVPPRLCNLQPNSIVRNAVCDVTDKHQAGCLDALDKRWCEIE